MTEPNKVLLLYRSFLPHLVINLFVKELYRQIWCDLTRSLTFGAVEMKSFMWVCVHMCVFLPSEGYSCLSFRGAPENPLWLASRPWDCIAFQDLLRQHQTGHLSQTPPQSCNPTQHGGQLISLYLLYANTERQTELYACVCVDGKINGQTRWQQSQGGFFFYTNIHTFP